MAKDNSSMYIISIVAIVALVGLVTLFLNDSGEEANIAGEATQFGVFYPSTYHSWSPSEETGGSTYEDAIRPTKADTSSDVTGLVDTGLKEYCGNGYCSDWERSSGTCLEDCFYGSEAGEGRENI